MGLSYTGLSYTGLSYTGLSYTGPCPLSQAPSPILQVGSQQTGTAPVTAQPHAMQWYKAPADGEEFQALDQSSDRFSIKSTNDYINFTIFRISYEDNGIYVCDSKNLTEEKRQPYLCGTELRVMSRSNIQQIQNRNTLKDTIIIIQTILLVIFISVPMLLFLEKGDGKESPEEDHTYEGLEVEQIATYEDITPFRDMKAKWTVGEHPGEE
ncbi:B-cell antigen receptor complex-associated protein beta chain isoform X10 [Tympanuchus pallidicinctus]|nr:B-cell antigen receptor complex-associated protein beta chain isoform X10 [Tympanuchus pallidicinctus]